jgi:hypothetical protein
LRTATFLSSLTGLFILGRAKPSLERLGYFRIHRGGIIGCSGAVSGRGVRAVVGHRPTLQDFAPSANPNGMGIIQPSVARHELRWVIVQTNHQP